MRNFQLLRSITATLIALTLVACGSDGEDGADGRNGADGSSPLVAVVSEPAGANCAAGGKRIDQGQDTNGNGVLDASEITDTQHVCNGVSPLTHTIGGTVAGLNGSVVLENNSDVLLTLSASGSFNFGLPVLAGDAYAVSVHTQPTGQTCTVANGSGIATANVTNVQVTCTTHPLTLLSTSPAADATDVDRTVSPSMVFSAALDAATLTPANVTLTSVAGDQPITLAVSGTQLSAIPTRQLLPATTYTLQATTNMQGVHGEQLAAAALASFTTQDGQWGAEVRADRHEGYAYLPHIAVDANGNALLVWQQYDGINDRIWANRYTPDSGWGTPVRIQNDAGDGTNPRVAMDADGNALAVWEQSDGTILTLWANRYTRGIGWGTPTLLETNDLPAAIPYVAFDAAGNALVMWRYFDWPRYAIWSNRYVAGWGWDAATPVTTIGADIYKAAAQLAVHASGNAVAVWLQGSSVSSVWANHYTVGEGWGTPVLIEEDDAGAADAPYVAMDGNGNALVVWEQSDGIRTNIWFNRSTPDGSWGTATLVETEDAEAGSPSIGIDAKGNVFAVWHQMQGANDAIRSNRYTPQGGWGTAEVIQSDVTHPAHAWQIVVDAAGNALAVWHALGQIYYNRYTNGRGWGISAPLTHGALGLQIATDAGGNAMAAWSRVVGTREDIYVKRFE